MTPKKVHEGQHQSILTAFAAVRVFLLSTFMRSCIVHRTWVEEQTVSNASLELVAPRLEGRVRRLERTAVGTAMSLEQLVDTMTFPEVEVNKAVRPQVEKPHGPIHFQSQPRNRSSVKKTENLHPGNDR